MTSCTDSADTRSLRELPLPYHVEPSRPLFPYEPRDAARYYRLWPAGAPQFLGDWPDDPECGVSAWMHFVGSAGSKDADLVQEAEPQAAALAASGFARPVQWIEDARTVLRAHEVPESSTQASPRAIAIGARVDRVFASAADETFEDGMESGFSRALVDLVMTHGAEAVAAIGDRVIGGALNPEAAGEALRWLGRLDPSIAHRQRLYVLEHRLNAPSAYVVDGALLGLASMDDPDALPYLKLAAQQRTNPDQRRDFEQVISQLEETQRCRSC